MGSRRGGNGNNETQTLIETQIQSRDPKSNPVDRRGSLCNITIDEVQTQLLDLGKPLSGMNLDELLKKVWGPEGDNQVVDVENGSAVGSGSLSSNLYLSGDLSKKTFDEVWRGIQQEQERGIVHGNASLGTMTLEDFLVMAGAVAKSSRAEEASGTVLGEVDPVGLSREAQWMNFEIPSIHPLQKQQDMVPVFMQDRPIQRPTRIGINRIMDAACSKTQITVPPYTLSSALSDTQSPGRKRVELGEIVEKTVERRQKRMMKNRESAARSRARKQAYTNELEYKISLLEEENLRLKKRMVDNFISSSSIFMILSAQNIISL